MQIEQGEEEKENTRNTQGEGGGGIDILSRPEPRNEATSHQPYEGNMKHSFGLFFPTPPRTESYNARIHF